jgi:ABC-type glycerol-3-phosphate transport system substrate-binding protein
MDPTTTTPSAVSEPVPSMGETPQKPFTPPTLPSVPTLPLKPILFALVGLVILGIIGFALKTFLSSNTSSPQTTNRQINLVYWGMIEDTPQLQGVIKDFQAQNPGVTIQYSYQSPKDYSDRLVSACSRGQCPDIFRYHSTWTPSYLAKGLLSTAPSTIVSPSEFSSTFYPVASEDLRTATGVVGMPAMYDGLGLFVNKRILQDSGKSVPVTWDELRSLARLLTIRNAAGGIDRAGVALGTSSNIDHFSDILSVLILQNGGNPGKPEAFGSGTTTGANAGQSSLVGDALTFYTQFSRDDRVWDDTLPNSTYAFAIERVAMIIAPAYRAAEIKKLNPNFDFAVYPIPQLPGKPVTFANYWAEGVAKSSKEQETAWKFLKFLTSKESLAKLYPIGSDQMIKQVYPRTDMQNVLINNPYAGAIVKQAPSSKSFYMSSRTFDKGINDKMIEAYADIVTKMQQNTKYEALAPAFSTTISTLLTTFGIRP